MGIIINGFAFRCDLALTVVRVPYEIARWFIMTGTQDDRWTGDTEWETSKMGTRETYGVILQTNLYFTTPFSVTRVGGWKWSYTLDFHFAYCSSTLVYSIWERTDKQADDVLRTASGVFVWVWYRFSNLANTDWRPPLWLAACSVRDTSWISGLLSRLVEAPCIEAVPAREVFMLLIFARFAERPWWGKEVIV